MIKLPMCLKLFGLLVLLHHSLNAADFGTASFTSGPDGWYTISTDSYPNVAPLSQGRNRGDSSGSIFLSPSGFTLGEDGDYEISITAILTNPVESSSVIIPVFLAVAKQGDPDVTEVDPADPNPLGGAGVITSNDFTSIHGTGVLKGLEAGSRLSLVVTNAGYPVPQPVTVISWSITVVKL